MSWITEVIEATVYAAVWQYREYPTEGTMWETWCRIRRGYGLGKVQPLLDALELEVLELERRLKHN